MFVLSITKALALMIHRHCTPAGVQSALHLRAPTSVGIRVGKTERVSPVVGTNS